MTISHSVKNIVSRNLFLHGRQMHSDYGNPNKCIHLQTEEDMSLIVLKIEESLVLSLIIKNF